MRKFLLKSLIFVFLILGAFQNLQAQNGELLDPLSQTKFINELAFPPVMQPETENGNFYKVSMSQFQQHLGLFDEYGQPLMTTVWGYNGLYPGPTIEAFKDEEIIVRWENNLVDEDGFLLDHLFPLDPTVHRADPPNGIPLVTHLHGGHTEAASDGTPQAWFTQNFQYTGEEFVKQNYVYANDQEAATLWYHDHALGITRLNVYAGLAGFYLLRDEFENSLQLPSGEYEVPLVIQDRSFYENGELYYPSDTSLLEDPLEEPLPTNTTILPEMFGDFILVNGKVWPYLEVEPRKYRLRILNGSDSRFYDLSLPGVNFYQIGSDGGLLNSPVKMSRLLIGPGERLDMIADFSAPELFGTTLILKNIARSPYPFGGNPDPQTTGQIMAFKVSKELNTEVPPYTIPTYLRPAPISRLENNSEIRQLVLFEGTDEYGRLKPMLGTATDGPLGFLEEITENPMLGDIEDWEIYNTTADAHPVHLHLVHFQVLNTQKFNTKKFDPGDPTSIELLGQPTEPSVGNSGWKDTYIVRPGEVARVRALFDREGLYVWHCHILSHEDYDMMRPFYVGEIPYEIADIFNTSSDFIADTEMEEEHLNSFEISPNPIRNSMEIRFNPKENTSLQIGIYDSMGRELAVIYTGNAKANETLSVPYERSNLSPGTYFCKISTEDGRSFTKTIIVR
ncbi:MAG: multicopper oxidase domain-containing protein [Christiangramia sp.]|nr:multicopper oxidase domain-containing protein [Christiangramia sp.]